MDDYFYWIFCVIIYRTMETMETRRRGDVSLLSAKDICEVNNGHADSCVYHNWCLECYDATATTTTTKTKEKLPTIAINWCAHLIHMAYIGIENRRTEICVCVCVRLLYTNK